MKTITYNQPGRGKTVGYVLEREELIIFREKGLLKGSAYIALAIKIDTGTYDDISISDFCARWQISKNSYYKALATLRKCGILDGRVEI